jgi:hypothetical protein
MSVEAKAKVRARHNEAIVAFRRWQRKHPRADLDEQVRQFDLLCDTAKLKSIAPDNREKEMVK